MMPGPKYEVILHPTHRRIDFDFEITTPIAVGFFIYVVFCVWITHKIFETVGQFINDIVGMFNFYKSSEARLQQQNKREAAFKREISEMMERRLLQHKSELLQQLEQSLESVRNENLKLQRKRLEGILEIKELLRAHNLILTNQSIPTASPPESAKTLPINVKTEEMDSLKYLEERKRNESTILAVDATPSRGGGILYNPATNSAICYSVDWKRVFNFDFDDSDKFEMVNALLAVEIFSDTLGQNGSLHCFVHSIIFKADNTFILDGYKKLKHSKFRDIYDEFLKILSSFHSNITIQHSTRKTDAFIECADRLSRDGVSICNAKIHADLGDVKFFKRDDDHVNKVLNKVANRLKAMSENSGERYSFLVQTD